LCDSGKGHINRPPVTGWQGAAAAKLLLLHLMGVSCFLRPTEQAVSSLKEICEKHLPNGYDEYELAIIDVLGQATSTTANGFSLGSISRFGRKSGR
jgi:hypothetical protein